MVPVVVGEAKSVRLKMAERRPKKAAQTIFGMV